MGTRAPANRRIVFASSFFSAAAAEARGLLSTRRAVSFQSMHTIVVSDHVLSSLRPMGLVLVASALILLGYSGASFMHQPQASGGIIMILDMAMRMVLVALPRFLSRCGDSVGLEFPRKFKSPQHHNLRISCRHMAFRRLPPTSAETKQHTKPYLRVTPASIQHRYEDLIVFYGFQYILGRI